MERHHKIILGSLSTLFIIYMIINSIFVYFLLVKIDSLEQNIDNQFMEIRVDTQSKINQLTSVLLDTLRENEEATSEQIKQLKATTSTDFSEVIENSLDSVVTIRTDVSQGTGFILTSRGFIVTNAHVLNGGNFIQVVTSKQEIINAQFIGWDTQLDLALIKIPGTHEYLELANSEDIQVGEKVIAIGNPLGLQFSVSEGIVSAINRKTPFSPGKYIQTDTALNPGNSGGPLIDKEGLVIGINNFKLGDFEGIGFALESDSIKSGINNIALITLNSTLI